MPATYPPPILGGMSGAINVKPAGVCSWACVARVTEPGEGADSQVTAEDGGVELHRLACVAVEGQVGVERDTMTPDDLIAAAARRQGVRTL